MNAEQAEKFSKKVNLVSREISDNLELEFDSMLAEHSRDGKLASGATIKRTMGFIASGNANLYLAVNDHLEKLNLQYYPKIEGDVKELAIAVQVQYKNKSLEKLKKSAAIAGKSKLYERMIPEVEASMVSDYENFENSLNVIAINLKNSRTMSVFGKWLWYLEALLLAISLFIAGMWYKNPTGNYEPILVVLALVIPAIAIGIKTFIKN